MDESGIVAGGRVSYGYAPRGQRREEYAPYRKGCCRSLIGWVGLDQGGVVAVEGSVNGDLFERFVREHLCPRLREGDLVVYDNHSNHKRPELRPLIRAQGCPTWRGNPQPRVQRLRRDLAKGEAPRSPSKGGHRESADGGAPIGSAWADVAVRNGVATACGLRDHTYRVALYAESLYFIATGTLGRGLVCYPDDHRIFEVARSSCLLSDE